MIELRDDELVFSFPDVHADAVLRISFQRTLRIPDDDNTYPLPPGLGHFPLRHVDDFAERVSETWMQHGGVMLPMYQSEAMWLHFTSENDYPFAVKVATGKINAVSGEAWRDGVHRDPQDYMVVPGQPWLDGYCVSKGMIRQFVAMPLGNGYTVEEQITGDGVFGGIQIVVHPLKREAYERLQRKRPPRVMFSCVTSPLSPYSAMDMGLAPGGKMAQVIYRDKHKFADWDLREKSRCFVHLANAMVWRGVTGENAPTVPPTAEEYTRAGLPWFEYYAGDQTALGGAVGFSTIKSITQLGKMKGEVVLPENGLVSPIKKVGLRAKNEVREGAF